MFIMSASVPFLGCGSVLYANVVLRVFFAFWMDLEGPDLRKLISRVSETLISTRSVFSLQERFLIQDVSQNGVQKD